MCVYHHNLIAYIIHICGKKLTQRAPKPPLLEPPQKNLSESCSHDVKKCDLSQ